MLSSPQIKLTKHRGAMVLMRVNVGSNNRRCPPDSPSTLYSPFVLEFRWLTRQCGGRCREAFPRSHCISHFKWRLCIYISHNTTSSLHFTVTLASDAGARTKLGSENRRRSTLFLLTGRGTSRGPRGPIAEPRARVTIEILEKTSFHPS